MDFVSRTDNKAITGNSGSTYRYIGNLADLASDRTALLRAVDALDSTLMCASVASELLNKDYATGKVELTASFIPAWRLNAMIPNSNWRRRIVQGAESFTFVPLKGAKAKWASGKAIRNRNILPLMTVAVDQITLFGTRTTVDLSTWASYQNKVNSDTFLGATAGFVLFKGASADPRQLEDGTMTNDVQLHLARRYIEWNKDYNEDTGAWEVVYPDGTNPKFGSVAMSGLGTLA